MNKAKLFLYDFITKKKIRKYAIALALSVAAAYYWRANNPDWMLGVASMSNIGLSIAFMTTLYSIFTYSTTDRIKAYLMLPCKKVEVLFSFVFAQYYSLLLERLGFVIVAAAFFSREPTISIAYLLPGSLCTVMLDTVLLMAVNRKRYALAALALSLVAGLYILLTYSRNSLINFAVLAVMLLISGILMAGFNAKHLAINRESKVKDKPLHRINYFFTVLTREKIVLVNTASVFIFAGVFALISTETPVLQNLIWGVVAMNTPATTMFSGDKALMRQEKMLPRHSRLMSCVYASFLAAYFAVANVYVMAIHALIGQFSVFTVLIGVAFTVVETGVSLFLERRFPIREWQKKQEVWRNPRKYILPAIVCVIALAPYLLSLPGM